MLFSHKSLWSIRFEAKAKRPILHQINPKKDPNLHYVWRTFWTKKGGLTTSTFFWGGGGSAPLKKEWLLTGVCFLFLFFSFSSFLTLTMVSFSSNWFDCIHFFFFFYSFFWRWLFGRLCVELTSVLSIAMLLLVIIVLHIVAPYCLVRIIIQVLR